MSVSWNPWHGCQRVSEGCRECYVYRQDAAWQKDGGHVVKTTAFSLPCAEVGTAGGKFRPGRWCLPVLHRTFCLPRPMSGAVRHGDDPFAAGPAFYVFTKRIDRLSECLPGDWGAGYEHVTIGCTVENQRMADYRLPIFQKLPIRHKIIVCAPLIGPIDLAPYLGPEIEQVSVGGESGPEARVCDYAWVLSLRDQCAEHDVSFCFHQTGARLLKDGRLYRIRRQFQHTQARKAGIDFKVGG